MRKVNRWTYNKRVTGVNPDRYNLVMRYPPQQRIYCLLCVGKLFDNAVWSAGFDDSCLVNLLDCTVYVFVWLLYTLLPVCNLRLNVQGISVWFVYFIILIMFIVFFISATTYVCLSDISQIITDNKYNASWTLENITNISTSWAWVTLKKHALIPLIRKNINEIIRLIIFLVTLKNFILNSIKHYGFSV